MAEATVDVRDELKTIKQDLVYIKEHMVDVDCIMTEEDYLALQEYRKEKKTGKLTSHAQLKKEMGL